MNEAAVRGLKQLARIALAAAVASLATSAVVPGSNTKTIVVAALVAAYEGVSKYVHDNKDISLNGLYPF